MSEPQDGILSVEDVEKQYQNPLREKEKAEQEYQQALNNVVESTTRLEDLKEELKRNGTRDYMLFYTGINSGMRVSDIVKLTRDDVRNSDGSMKQYITVIEKKTGKQKRFSLCNGLLVEMEKYTENVKTGEYLFKSRKGENRPITTVQAYRIISEAAKRIGLEEIGTHTMRKTF